MLNDRLFDEEDVIREAHRIDHLIMTSDPEGKAAAWREKIALLNNLDRESARLAALRERVAENPERQLRIQFGKKTTT